jgi:hypothetical protein
MNSKLIQNNANSILLWLKWSDFEVSTKTLTVQSTIISMFRIKITVVPVRGKRLHANRIKDCGVAERNHEHALLVNSNTLISFLRLNKLAWASFALLKSTITSMSWSDELRTLKSHTLCLIWIGNLASKRNFRLVRDSSLFRLTNILVLNALIQ